VSDAEEAEPDGHGARPGRNAPSQRPKRTIGKSRELFRAPAISDRASCSTTGLDTTTGRH